jgi:hypothetical protein
LTLNGLLESPAKIGVYVALDIWRVGLAREAKT